MIVHKIITSIKSQYFPEDSFSAPRFMCFPQHVSKVNPPIVHNKSRRAEGRHVVSRTFHISISLPANCLYKIYTQQAQPPMLLEWRFRACGILRKVYRNISDSWTRKVTPKAAFHEFPYFIPLPRHLLTTRDVLCVVVLFNS